jgi:hypothetical protein
MLAEKMRTFTNFNNGVNKSNTLKLLEKSEYTYIENKSVKIHNMFKVISVVLSLVFIFFYFKALYNFSNIYLNISHGLLTLYLLFLEFNIQSKKKKNNFKIIHSKTTKEFKEKITNIFLIFLLAFCFVPFCFVAIVCLLLYLIPKNKIALETKIMINKKEYDLKVTYNLQEYLYINGKLHTEDVNYPSVRLNSIDYSFNEFHYKGEELKKVNEQYFDQYYMKQRIEEIDKKLIKQKLNKF